MEFNVRCFESGAVRELPMQAATREELAQRLEAEGTVVLSIRRARSMALRGQAVAAEVLDVAWWCRELRTLLAAGMTVVEAIEALQAQPLGLARAQVHAVLVAELRSGKPLSAAMRSAGQFPDILVASVKASERTSGLVQALDDYLQFHDMLMRLRRQMVSAALYPAVVVGLGSVIVLFLLLYVIPRFSGIYADLHGDMSWTTTLVVHASTVLQRHGLIVGVVGAVLALLLWQAWRTGWVVQALWSLVEAVPALRSRLDMFRLAKLYQSMALMFRGGYALDEALDHCEGLGLGERLSAAVRAAKAGLNRGQRVSTSFEQAGLTDPVSLRLLAVGERTGNFDRVLQTIGERHASDFATFIERATRLVEPLLLMVVALVVGGIVVMMYMPVFDIASSVR